MPLCVDHLKCPLVGMDPPVFWSLKALLTSVQPLMLHLLLSFLHQRGQHSPYWDSFLSFSLPRGAVGWLPVINCHRQVHPLLNKPPTQLQIPGMLNGPADAIRGLWLYLIDPAIIKGQQYSISLLLMSLQLIDMELLESLRTAWARDGDVFFLRVDHDLSIFFTVEIFAFDADLVCELFLWLLLHQSKGLSLKNKYQ